MIAPVAGALPRLAPGRAGIRGAIERIPTAAVVDQQIEAAADPQGASGLGDARVECDGEIDLAGDRRRAVLHILEQNLGGRRLLVDEGHPLGQAHHDAGPSHLELITATVDETCPGPKGRSRGELAAHHGRAGSRVVIDPAHSTA